LDQIQETVEVQVVAVVVVAAVVVVEAVVAVVVLVLVAHPESVRVKHHVGKLDRSVAVETRIGDKICGRCDCRATS